jgi:hypothetical protein
LYFSEETINWCPVSEDPGHRVKRRLRRWSHQQHGSTGGRLDAARFVYQTKGFTFMDFNGNVIDPYTAPTCFWKTVPFMIGHSVIISTRSSTLLPGGRVHPAGSKMIGANGNQGWFFSPAPFQRKRAARSKRTVIRFFK